MWKEGERGYIDFLRGMMKKSVWVVFDSFVTHDLRLGNNRTLIFSFRVWRYPSWCTVLAVSKVDGG
jgi:hypothetical protein